MQELPKLNRNQITRIVKVYGFFTAIYFAILCAALGAKF
jgi:hypothetical protein